MSRWKLDDDPWLRKVAEAVLGGLDEPAALTEVARFLYTFENANALLPSVRHRLARKWREPGIRERYLIEAQGRRAPPLPASFNLGSDLAAVVEAAMSDLQANLSSAFKAFEKHQRELGLILSNVLGQNLSN